MKPYGVAVRHRVVVTLTTGKSFDGILWSSSRGCLVLKDARLFTNSAPVQLDGDVVVEYARVEYVQVLGG